MAVVAGTQVLLSNLDQPITPWCAKKIRDFFDANLDRGIRSGTDDVGQRNLKETSDLMC